MTYPLLIGQSTLAVAADAGGYVEISISTNEES
jgi:hypothetical protein